MPKFSLPWPVPVRPNIWVAFLAVLGVSLFSNASIGPHVASASPSQIFLSDCDFGFHSGVYTSNEVVCVSGQVRLHAGEFIFPSGDVYITKNVLWLDGVKFLGEHADITNGANTVVGANLGGVFFDAIVWLPLLHPGEYDMVLDDNKNGVYDVDTDVVVGGGSNFAIRVIPAPLGAFIVDVEKIKQDAANNREVWKGTKKTFAIITILKTTLDATKALALGPAESGKFVVDFVLGKASEILGTPGLTTNQGKLDIKTKSYNDSVLDVAKKYIEGIGTVMITHYNDLARDPADPDFQQIVILDLAAVDVQLDGVTMG